MLGRLLPALFGLSARRQRLAHRLAGKPAAAPLFAYLSSPLPARRDDWRQARYLVLDLETTGSDPRRDDILSFGWICLDGEEIPLGSARHRLVLPRRALNESSVAIHRITDDRAAGGEGLRQVLDDFLAELAGRVLIAHYSPTEIGFLDRACRNCYGGGFLSPHIDTLELARRLLPASPPPGSLRLGTLRQRHHLPRYPLHHALSDALATAELFLAQTNALGRRASPTVGQLLLD